MKIHFSEEIRNEIKALKKEYKNEKKSHEPKDEQIDVKEKEKQHNNQMVQNYLSEQRKYNHLKKDVPKKGSQRYIFAKILVLIALSVHSLILFCVMFVILFASEEKSIHYNY